MKNYSFILLLTLSLSFFFSCKKDPVLSNTTVTGTWSGRYTSTPNTVFVKFTFQEDGNVSISDTSGSTIFPAVYTISGDSLIAIVNPAGPSSINFRFKASNQITRMEGKWKSTSTSAYEPIFLDKE